MTAKDAVYLGALVVLVVGVREMFPKVEEREIPVPTIVTVHDTVHDTVHIRAPRIVTTDTLQLIIRQTIHDTVLIEHARPGAIVWPVLAMQVGDSRGATSRVTTFNLGSGKVATSEIWTPGPLKSLWADTSGTPRMEFYEWPKPARPSLWHNVKVFGAGWAGCLVTHSVVNDLRGGHE